MKYIIPLIFLFAFSSQDQIDTSKALIISLEQEIQNYLQII